MTKVIPIAIITILATSVTAYAHPGMKKGAAKHFDRMDKDGSGSLSLDEMKAGMQAYFTRADADHNGKVTRDEVRALAKTKRDGWKARHGDKRAEKPNKKKHKHHMKRRGAHGHGERMARRFDKMDTNGDGVIEPGEISARAQKRFEAMDADNDGAVTRQEMRSAAKAKFRKHHRRRHGKQHRINKSRHQD